MTSDSVVGAIADDPPRSLLSLGDITIVCDVRIANFGELATGFVESVGRRPNTEAALLLELWKSADAEAIQKAQGEAAFAIIEHDRDGVIKTLCAGDPLEVRDEAHVVELLRGERRKPRAGPHRILIPSAWL